MWILRKKKTKPMEITGRPIELGTIRYSNITAGAHGDFEKALFEASLDQNPERKPIFCNFVEWAG